MRGFGAFQQAQMRRGDPRIAEFFRTLRSALELLEAIALHPAERGPEVSAPPKTQVAKIVLPQLPPKLAYSIKEVSALLSVGRTRIYDAVQKKELRIVKCRHRTLILDADLRAWIDSWRAPSDRAVR